MFVMFILCVLLLSVLLLFSIHVIQLIWKELSSRSMLTVVSVAAAADLLINFKPSLNW